MRQFARRLSESSSSAASIKKQTIRKISQCNVSRNVLARSTTALRPTLYGSSEPHGHNIRRQRRHYSGPYWFLEEDFIQQLYGGGKKAEEKPQDGPNPQWWATVEYPRDILAKKRGKFLKQLEPPPQTPPPPPLPRNYLSNRPITSDQVVKDLFGGDYPEFHDFMRESRVERMFTLGKLLVDEPEVYNDYAYWLRLLKFRARIHGEKGVKDVWFGITMRRIELPVKGDTADEIWKLFVRVGLENEDFLNKLYQYHLHTYYAKSKMRWKPMYNEVVGGFLHKKKFIKALWWHHRLVEQTPKANLVKVFEEHAEDSGSLHVLFKIFSSKKVGQVYKEIIPILGRRELCRVGLIWHTMFFKKGDIPTDSQPADRLLEYLSFHEPLKRVELMLQEFHSKGVKLKESSVIALIRPRYRTSAIMELFCRLYDTKVISNECFGDRFWAFLLSFQHLSGSDVNKYMARLGITAIGELSTKEFIKRGNTFVTFIRGMSLLNMKKVNADAGIYDRYLEVKAKWMPEEAFRESLPIEGLEVSRGNALLQGYLSTYRWRYFDLIYKGIRRKNHATWNLLLQKLFMTRRFTEALELMEEMRAIGLPIKSSAQRELLRAILLPRHRGHRPVVRGAMARGNKDLFLATNYLRAIMLNGNRVSPMLWREILKRYGMLSKLKDLEKLCHWLVEWYDPRKAALLQVKVPIDFSNVKEVASLNYAKVEWTEPPVGYNPRSAQNALRVMFPATTIRSLVEWGFIAMQRSWYLNLLRKDKRLGKKARFSLSTWGIRLVKNLQQKGVWVDSRSVARAVRVRLRALEGSKQHWESFDTNISKQEEPINLSRMAAIAEKAWGGRLFPRGSWDTEEGLMRMLKSPVKDLVIGRRRPKPRRLRLPTVRDQHTPQLPTSNEI